MVRIKEYKRAKFAIPMKKSFHISFAFLLILFFTTILGYANHKKSTVQEGSLQDQKGLKAAESLPQQDILFIASITENDFDVDKTFLDLPFTLFMADLLSGKSKTNGNPVIHSDSESVHHYHLPKYLLFHNLKITS